MGSFKSEAILVLVEDRQDMQRAFMRLASVALGERVHMVGFDCGERALEFLETVKASDGKIIVVCDGDLGPGHWVGPTVLEHVSKRLGQKLLLGCLYSSDYEHLKAARKAGFRTFEKPNSKPVIEFIRKALDQ